MKYTRYLSKKKGFMEHICEYCKQVKHVKKIEDEITTKGFTLICKECEVSMCELDEMVLLFLMDKMYQ